MTRRRILDDDQAEQLYQEYLLFLQNRPKKLRERYGISSGVMSWYIRKLHKTRKAA